MRGPANFLKIVALIALINNCLSGVTELCLMQVRLFAIREAVNYNVLNKEYFFWKMFFCRKIKTN